MSNRLLAAASLYLRQHADNPIDWWEWTPEAFEEAQLRHVPILLSVGYSACHWCHVMAHESFEDAATAAQLNRDFVAIKVDREERPDIDSIYLAATKTMTGSAGWPLTCLLTPEGEPFHCGTYYPANPRPGVPSFRQVLTAATAAWRENSDMVRATAAQIAKSLTASASLVAMPLDLGEKALANALRSLTTTFDNTNGGFGAAPKFPPSMVAEFLLRHHERTGSEVALGMAQQTLENLARGGICDQLTGGFARYCVDGAWRVPHFEKMLYDNALLLRVYAHLSRRTHSPLVRRVCEETAAFILSTLRTPEGGFAAALSANSDGIEGGSYVWDPNMLRLALGDVDAEWAANLLDVTETGTFQDGLSVPRLESDPDDSARWERIRSALSLSRAQRPQPTRDDKVITAWNGLTIAALAEAGALLGRPSWVAAACDAADLLLDLHMVDGRLRRSSLDGRVGAAAGVLEDYGYLADGLLALHQATGNPRWLETALVLLDIALGRFAMDGESGEYFDTADDAGGLLLHRPRELTDGASPCGSSALAGALLTASVLAPRESAGRYRQEANAALAAAAMGVLNQPQFSGHWLSVAEAAMTGPIQVALTGSRDDPRLHQLQDAARHAVPGGAVVVSGAPDSPGVPLLMGRPLVDDGPAAYVCHGTVCAQPVNTTEALTAALNGHGARQAKTLGETTSQ